VCLVFFILAVVSNNDSRVFGFCRFLSLEAFVVCFLRDVVFASRSLEGRSAF